MLIMNNVHVHVHVDVQCYCVIYPLLDFQLTGLFSLLFRVFINYATLDMCSHSSEALC